jgi:hypothetical protein
MLAAASVGRGGPSGRSAKNPRLMHRGRHIAVLLVALLVAVALPAAAIAQSAGEDQYTDPLQGGGSSGGGGNSGGGSSGGGGGGNAPTTQAQSDTTPAASTNAEPAQAEDDDSGNLPNTGFPIAILLGSGMILLSTGLALRRNA